MSSIKFFVAAAIAVYCLLSPKNCTGQIDSEAVAILDKMNDNVAALSSCSLTLKTEYDVFNDIIGLVKHSDQAKIYLKAPNKLLINRKGDKGTKDIYYDGNNLYYYSWDNDQYATAPAPPTILEMIDSLHSKLGIDFPASDVFYPDFTDELILISTTMLSLGTTTVDDKECFHIAGVTDSVSYQVWVENKEPYLPVKIGIVYNYKIGNPQYEAVYSNWELDPALSDSMFDFTAPAGANKIKFVTQ